MEYLRLQTTQTRTAADLAHVVQNIKCVGVSERNKDDAVVRERRERVDHRSFLATSRRARGDKHTSKLAVELALLPGTACVIPKRLKG